jgi:hypothetical protein
LLAAYAALSTGDGGSVVAMQQSARDFTSWAAEPLIGRTGDVAADRRDLGLRWLKLAEKARAASRTVGQSSKPAAPLPARA